MERLDQGHLYPLTRASKTVISRASAVGGEHSSKELFEQLVNSYSEHLHELATVYYFLYKNQCYVVFHAC